MPGYHQGRAPRNKGLRYPADPPTIEEIVVVMRAAGDQPDGARLRALIVLLWRAGLRIGEALDLAETDLDRSRGAVLVRRGKGGKRREVGMDRWAWDQLSAVARVPSQPPGGSSVLRDPRRDSTEALRALRRSQATSTNRRSRRCPSPVRAAPTTARARDRDGPRGRPARCHPTPAWALCG
jgi:integrase